MKHQKIEYQLTEPDIWYKHLSRFLPSTVKDSQLIFGSELGEGKLKYLKVQDGFWAQQYNFKLQQDLELLRIAKSKNDFFIINFYLSNAEITREINCKTFTRNFENINLVLTSSTTRANVIIPANERVEIFNLVLSKDWLFKNVILDHGDLKEFFDNDNPVCLSENLDYNLKGLLKRIDFDQNNRLTSISNIIQIVEYLFNQFKSRELVSARKSIHPDDLNNVIKVREILDVNPEKEILLQDLSNKAGMSLSKFKRLFKQVFGTTPYRYHLKNKMDKAMEILQTGTHSVSETGFLMGYSNLSQFSKAFKNQFGILPSEVNN